MMVNSFIVSVYSRPAACSQQQLDKLQRVLNCAARVIYGGRRGDHVTPLLRDNLHWLRIRERITFKLCLLVSMERIWFGSRANLQKIATADQSLRIDRDIIHSVASVRDLGVTLDSELT